MLDQVLKGVILPAAVLLSFFYTDPAEAARRMALVIGNGNYETAPLANPENDARLIANSLESVGFEVSVHLDLEHYEFGRVISEFGEELRLAGDDTVGVFFYAGHAVQAQGRNYLIPVDAQPRSVIDLQFQTISMDIVLASLDQIGPSGLKMVFLDACRDNPFVSQTRSASRGLSRIGQASGTFISYSTAPGQVAEDGVGVNSPYSQSLARRLQEPNLLLEQVMRLVRLDVLERTGHQQEPWTESSLGGDFYFLEEESTEISEAQRRADAAAREAALARQQAAATALALEAAQAETAAREAELQAERERLADLESQLQQSSTNRDDDRASYQEVQRALQEAEAAALLREEELAAERQRLAALEAELQQLNAVRGQTDTGSDVQVASLSPSAAVEGSSSEEVFWNSVKGLENPALLEAYLQQFPNGRYVTEARNLLDALSQQIDWQITLLGDSAASNESLANRIDTLPSGEGELRAALIEQQTERFLDDVDFTRDGLFIAEAETGELRFEITVSGDEMGLTMFQSLRVGGVPDTVSNCSSPSYNPQTGEFIGFCASITATILETKIEGDSHTLKGIVLGHRVFNMPVQYQLTNADRAEIETRVDFMVNQIAAIRTSR